MNTCLKCKTLTRNKKFCSRSCAVSHNNKIPKRKAITRNCKHCNIILNPEGRECSRTVCDSCCHNIIDWSKVTYSEVSGKRLYQKNSRIRNLARASYKSSNRPKYCAVCGYDKHYEVCHIKPINKHLPQDSVTKINDDNNLVALCPNHHWELDYGDLSIDDITQ